MAMGFIDEVAARGLIRVHPIDGNNKRHEVPTTPRRISMLILGPCYDTQVVYQACSSPPATAETRQHQNP